MAEAARDRGQLGPGSHLHSALHDPASVCGGHGLLQPRQSGVRGEAAGDGAPVLYRVEGGKQRRRDVRVGGLHESHRVRVRGPAGGAAEEQERQSHGFGLAESVVELSVPGTVRGQDRGRWVVRVRLQWVQQSHLQGVEGGTPVILH